MTNNSTTFGLPVESDASLSDTVKSHWVLMAAAATTDPAVRDLLVDSVHARAANPDYRGAFPSTFRASNGEMLVGSASAAQGAMFAALVLNLPVQKLSTNDNVKDQESTGGANAGPIAGGVVGGVVAIAVLVGLVLLLKRRRRKSGAIQSSREPMPIDTQPTQSFDQPYIDGSNLYSAVAPSLNGPGHVIRQQMSTLLQEREYDVPPPEYVPP